MKRLNGSALSFLWRVSRDSPYLRGMGIARRRKRVEALPRLRALDEYAGQWVAVKDGEVIAHSPSPREVVRQMRKLGPRAEGAVLQRVATPTEALAVGLG